MTALYVTHDQVEAMTLADRMIVMNAGRADQIGKPLEVYSNPQTDFVAGFIGSPPTNFLDPVLVGRSMPADNRLGVRPEHMQLLIAGAGRVQAQVLHAEALGAETLVHLRLPDRAQITVRQDGAMPPPHDGTAVGLDWADVDEMVFGPDGRRL